MDRRQLDRLVPMLFGLAVVVCAIWVQSALLVVAVVGGVAVAIYYSVFRGRMVQEEGDGRQRNRDR